MHGPAPFSPLIFLIVGLSVMACRATPVSQKMFFFPTIILSPDFLVNFVLKMAKNLFFLNYYKVCQTR